jgi:hypothetical protein
MAIQSQHLSKTDSETRIVEAALTELVSQQARVLATACGKIVSIYTVENELAKLNRIVEVLTETKNANGNGW